MLPTILSVSSLLFSFAVLCLGHGLNNTLIGVRAVIQEYPDWVTGLMMSAYFVGFIIGIHWCSRLIPVVGHIRSFAAFASVASAISLAHALTVEPVFWVLLRLVYGVCVAGFYMVIESWLNALSTSENRGRILSVYMVLNFLALATGQLLLMGADPGEYTLFAVVSILISLSLVPLTISKARQPDVELQGETFGLHRLIRTSPLAVTGIIVTALCSGGFWGMGAVYLAQIGFVPRDIAFFLSLTLIGGLLFQWPLGALSDRINRRYVIALGIIGTLTASLGIISVMPVGVAPSSLGIDMAVFAMLFGGSLYPLYSLYIALANDFLEPEHLVRASGGLLQVHAAGSAFGPLLASLAMSIHGAEGLFLFIATIMAMLLGFAVLRIVHGRAIPQRTQEEFVPYPRTASGAFALHAEEGEKETTSAPRS